MRVLAAFSLGLAVIAIVTPLASATADGEHGARERYGRVTGELDSYFARAFDAAHRVADDDVGALASVEGRFYRSYTPLRNAGDYFVECTGSDVPCFQDLPFECPATPYRLCRLL